ncbi:MAG TPA: radical SAM protein [Candidatus Brocadiales bacterium]|nr:radical SAM protein [Candidatus Brocadiales bacterium]
MATPKVALERLDVLWLQIVGTICNLNCKHCFIGCGPDVRRHKMLSRGYIHDLLDEASDLGVKEFYLTGGEPLLHPDILDIISLMLERSPTTILTNGTLISRETSERIAAIQHASRNRLEFRVSLESFNERENDLIRGPGSFDRAKNGIKNLVASGFNPIITATRWWDDDREEEFESGFNELISSLGIAASRLKILPVLYLGRGADTARPYREDERVTERCFASFPMTNLQCSHSRIVTSEGVFVCPILIDEPKARLGSRLKDGLGAYSMESHACYTCRVSGLTCTN